MYSRNGWEGYLHLWARKALASDRGSLVSSDLDDEFQIHSASDPRDRLAGCNIQGIDVEIEMWLVDTFRFANQALLGICHAREYRTHPSIGNTSFKGWMHSTWGMVKESLRYMTEQLLN